MKIERLIQVLGVLILGFSFLNGMDAPDKAKHTLIIENLTGQKLSLAYKYQEKDSTTTTTLNSKQPFTLEDPLLLDHLSIEPYGMLKGYMSANKLSAGFIESVNLAPEITEKGFDEPGSNIKLTISPNPSLLGSFSSFVTDISIIPSEEARELLDESKNPLAQLFNQVTKVVDELPPLPVVTSIPKPGEELPYYDETTLKIYPRYFLSVGEGASNEDIQAAYDRLIPILKERKSKTKGPLMVKFWERATEYLQVAYDTLMGKEGAQKHFDHLINHGLFILCYSASYGLDSRLNYACWWNE